MLLAIALMMSALPQQGDVTVRGVLSSHGTSVGQPVVFTVTVRSKSAEDPLIQMPALPDGLQIGSTSSSTELEIAMPGGRTNVVRQDIELIPTRPGAFSILPATVRIGGRTYHTERLDLSVGKSAAQVQAGGGSDAPIQLHASVTPKSPYVGQQLLLKLDAIMPADARFQPLRPPSYDPPAPGGFWIQDLPNPISAEMRTANGAPYEVQTFERAYFPLTPGVFTIPPARLIYDLRGGVFFAPETREIISDSIVVTVRAVPDAGKPASFTGAVGAFNISAGADRATVSAGDAVTFTMVVEGTGNVKSLPPPAFPKIGNVDVYPPSEDATLRVVNGVVGGTRSFTWVLIPRKAGTLQIPAVEYSWFDPSTERYQSSASAPVRIDVTPAVTLATAGGDTAIAPLRTRHGSRLAAFAMRRSFLLLQLLPLALLVLALFMRRLASSAGAGTRARKTALHARIAELDTLARSDGRAFYAMAIAACEDARAFGADEGITARADASIARFRAALYAPSIPDETNRRTDLDSVRALVHDAITTQRTHARRNGRADNAGAAAMIIAALAISMLAISALAPRPARASDRGTTDAGTQSQSELSDRAVTHYMQHDYAAAASDLALQVRQTSTDASAWYNLGNAYYRTNDPGRAAWAWLHALDLEPRSRDAKHNLGILNARRASAQVEGWFPVSTAELAWLAAACWWLCMLTTTAHVVRARASTRITAILLGTACATALVMLAARWIGPKEVVPVGHGAPLYAAPTRRTDIRDHLDVGDAAEILRRDGDWLLVRTSSFAEGWVPVDAVLEL